MRPTEALSNSASQVSGPLQGLHLGGCGISPAGFSLKGRSWPVGSSTAAEKLPRQTVGDFLGGFRYSLSVPSPPV